MKVLILFLSLILIGTGCAKKDPFTRQSQDSIKQPGLIIIGADKKSLAFYLNQNSLQARELGENSKVFEVQPTDIKKIEKAFPDAKVFRDQSFAVPQVDERMIVELSAKDAREIALKQLQTIKLEEAQAYSSGEGVIVAVIDSGINVTRYDLRPSLWINPLELPDNKIDDDNNGYVDDVHGWNFAENNHQLLDSSPHGTMSASLIASPLTGIAPKAKVIGLKVTDKNGIGTVSTMIEAILYARKSGAQIINLSMGTLTIEPRLHKAIRDLMADDILLVESAGNMASSCEENSAISSLYSLSKFISVAALNLPPTKLDLAKYSNFGECIHIAAPAGEGYFESNVLSRGIVTAHPYSPTSFYLYHGTSAAAPVVSGVAALIRSIRPDLAASQVKNILLESSTRHEVLRGRVDRERAVDALNAVKSALVQ